LRHAADLVDMTHSYIVLSPGRYEGFFGFSGQTATIVGNNATIALTSSDFAVHVFAGSAVTMRDIHLEEPVGVSTDGGNWVLVDKSSLAFDNVQTVTRTQPAIRGNGGDTVTIRRSSFTGQSVFVTRLVADACVFHTGGPSAESIELTNSIVNADSSVATSGTAVGINSSIFGSKIINNTFFQGTVSCSGVGAQFTNNIFYNYTSITATPSCAFQYNLVTPLKDLGGNGNTNGDPMFIDGAHGDFHLKLGSAAIDAGDPGLVSIDRDFEGTHRPQGTRSDIGAFEYKP
jgi:hypothetical protein